ncbi:MAG: anthranilate synthase component I [Actinomycetota bacterium]
MRGATFPDLEGFLSLTRDYAVVPVWREVLADLDTPVGVFRKLGGETGAFLLESLEGGERWARYSFVGLEPWLTLTGKGSEFSWQGNPPAGAGEGRNVLEALESALAALNAPALPGLPPFHGGAVGYLGYDVVRHLERLPDETADDLDLPDACMVFPRVVVAFDHLRQRLVLVANVPAPEHSREGYEAALARLDAVAAKLAEPSSYSPTAPPAMERGCEAPSNRSMGDFCEAVDRAKEYIRAGDIFQVVLSQRHALDTTANPLDVYRVLRLLNPSPYLFLLRLPEVTIVGSSPEALVKVQGDLAISRPIAGTRARGRDEAEDAALEAELVSDAKERAEHVMLVDLARNDLGRVCVPGTVSVVELLAVERYSHVMHLVSEVRGRLREGVGAFDVLEAAFPAGTVSGAPKVRAMEIIDELEPTRRGPYAGCVGYVDFSGNLDTCIAIRTLLFARGKAFVQAGAGIVADSVPEREWEETRNKAMALLAAVRAAEQMPPAGPECSPPQAP